MNQIPTPKSATRASLTSTAAANARWFARLATGAAVLGSTALAVDNLWTGSIDKDWNKTGNWSLGRVPAQPNGAPSGETFDDAIINTLTNFPVLTVNPSVTPRDIAVGAGGGNTGRLDVRAGTATSGGGNWSFVGREGGTGTLNVADTAGTGGALTGFGLGSGSFNSGGRLYIGGNQNAGAGVGTLNVRTTGSVTMGSDFAVGSSGGTGVANIDAGTVTTNGWSFIGKREAQDGGVGTLNLGGGTMTHAGTRLFIGVGNAFGTFNQTGGTYNNPDGGGDAFVVVGSNNLGNANTSALNITGGTFNANRLLTIGGVEPFGGNNDVNFVNSGKGSLTVNGASAVLNVTGEFWMGQGANSVGTTTLNAGAVNIGSWVAVGRGGGNGTLNINGGTFTKSGGGNFIVGDGSTGLLQQTNGTLLIAGEVWVGQGGAGNGTWNLSAGSVTVNNWVAVGREGGTGSLIMSGGSFTKNAGNDNNFIIGANGPGSLTQTGGLIDVQAGQIWLGEHNTSAVALSGSGEIRGGTLVAGVNGDATANVNLNGGTVRVDKFMGGGGTANIHFNGAQFVAKSNQTTDYMGNLDIADIQAGNLLVNTSGFNLIATQAFSGSGGIVKSGAGTLTLSGASTNTGANNITAGKLVSNTKVTGSGAYTVGNGTTLGVTLMDADEELVIPSASFGTGTAIEINLGLPVGNPSAGEAPLVITGVANLAGNVAINLVDPFPEIGNFPLVEYGSKTGAGNFVLGTLPQGMTATLNTSVPGVVSLNVTSLALPRWNGSTDHLWDTTTFNWIDLVSNLSSKYVNGNPVVFDDNATGPAADGSVVLNTAVTPASTIFSNLALNYTLSGTGAVNGSGTLTKQGTADLTIQTNNGYTGVTSLEGGTVNVATITNGGVASPLGAATSAPANLVFKGGILNYTGPNVTTDRGYSYGSPLDTTVNVIRTTNNLTIAGQVTAPDFGKLTKLGAGTLSFTFPGANVLGRGTGAPAPLRVDEGSLVLDGSGTQTNSVTGDLWVGTLGTTGAAMTLNNTSLSVSNYLAISRGNGTTGLLSTVTATNSNLALGALSLSFDNALAGHLASSTLTLNNSTLTTGDVNLGEGPGGTGTVTLNGTSTFTSNSRVLLGNSATASGTMIVGNNATFNRTGGWLSIGQNGTGVLTVKDSGTVNNTVGDFNVADVGTSSGTLNLQDSGTITAATTYIGKASTTTGTFNISNGTFTGGPLYMGQSLNSTGTINQTGGSITAGNNNEIRIGQDGTGIWNQSAGTVSISGWCVIGRFATGSGTLNVSGGTFNQVQGDRTLIVGEQGTGVLNISATGAVNAQGVEVVVSNGDTGNGTVNLDGGTLTAKRVTQGAGGVGTSAFNFNGGTLKAGTGANADFMPPLDTVTVKAGGAKIDSNGQTVGITSSLLDGGTGGGLTKSGTGTLYLNGFNTYLGLTTVSAGTLGGTGTITGSVSVANGATLSPGIATGGLFSVVDDVSFQSGANFGVTIGTLDSTLDVSDTLNLTNANLVLTGTPTLQAYVIATYGTLTGTFATLPTLPAGYSVNYHYNGSNQVAIVRPPNAFDTWINTYFPGETDQSVVGPNADPDGDGYKNSLEFALGGVPNDASNNPKVYQLIGDSSDAGTASELMMTIAVRNGTPVFAGSPSPTATQDGYTYTVQGSQNLASFTSAVSVVTPVTTGLPAAPTGYTYRTFSLDASNGLTGTAARGFMRVNVTP